MKKNEFFFRSSDNLTNIHVVIWEPENTVQAVVQITHGVTEHIMRYEELANYFTNKGIAVVGIDLLGHGLSTNNGNKVMYFGGIDSWDYVINDMKSCMNYAKEMFPNVPYILLGFSLGSYLARTYLIDNPDDFNASILIGTGYNSNFEIALGLSVANKEAKKYGDDKATEKIRSLTFDTYNKHFRPNRTSYDWLCKSNEMLDSYINDELRGGPMASGLFREMLRGMKYSQEKNNITKMNKNIHILLLSGSDDAASKFGNGIKKVQNLYKKNGINNVEYKIYTGLRHDILHEDERNIVYDDIYNWISKLFLNK